MITPPQHSDVIVVGAGSAGSVIAEQLSRDGNCSVTVLESGIGLNDPVLQAEAADGLHLPIGSASRLVRRYQSELTSRPADLVPIVRGATVGGSGAVNGGYFCRGLPGDFDEIGLPDWSWPAVLEHFRAIENDLDFGGPVHGVSGPIPVRRTDRLSAGTERFAELAQQFGFRWVEDLNGSDETVAPPVGIGRVPLNIVGGVRADPGSRCLLPALNRPNVTLLTETVAVRVEITGGRARGIRAICRNSPVTITADRIVLCAGAIESAHLLMLSGVGQESMLRNIGVEVVSPLPVGRACTDHPEWVLPVNWPAAGGRPPVEIVLHTADGIEIRPYTSGFSAMTDQAVPGRVDLPHIGVALMRPRARGRLTLVSADPLVAPRIEQRYDSEPADVAALHDGVELTREICGAATEDAMPVWSTSQHLCGTARMGRDTDERAVVDAQCRVRGVAGLWVVDGSVLPQATSRGPHATIVMLGHRAAEFVRAG